MSKMPSFAISKTMKNLILDPGSVPKFSHLFLAQGLPFYINLVHICR